MVCWSALLARIGSGSVKLIQCLVNAVLPIHQKESIIMINFLQSFTIPLSNRIQAIINMLD